MKLPSIPAMTALRASAVLTLVGLALMVWSMLEPTVLKCSLMRASLVSRTKTEEPEALSLFGRVKAELSRGGSLSTQLDPGLMNFYKPLATRTV